MGGSPISFLDGESSDWYAWKKSSSGVPQTFIIGPTGLCYLSKLGYGSGSYTQFINVFDTLVYGDEDPPYVTGHNPTDGADDVPVNKRITCHVKDDGFGVEHDSLSMTLTAQDRGEIDGTLTITGNFLNYTLKFTPDEDLPYGTEITAEVAAEDIEGNVMPTETWSFTTESDTTVAPASVGRIKAGFTE